MKKSVYIIAFFAFICFIPTADLFAQKTDGGAAEKTAQTSVAPKVVQIDEVKIKELLKPNGKPLLVNFWATCCVPCREEFPELVEIDEEYRGRIDFITITLDVPAEINRDVPKFLNEMKATMPTYLLKTPDENEVIGSISKDWAGGLPFTVLYDKDGNIAHTRQGIIKPDVVKGILEKLLIKTDQDQSYLEGKEDALIDVAEGKLILRYHECSSRTFTKSELLKPRHLIWFGNNQPVSEQPSDPNAPKFKLECEDTDEYKRLRYMIGYNSVSRPAIMKELEMDYWPKRVLPAIILFPKIISITLSKN